MDEIPSLPSDELPDLQRTVQRKLGRCLLQLQQYEKLLKAMTSLAELSGPADQLTALRELKIASVDNKTMGTLVGMLTENYMSVTSSGEATSRKPIDTDIQNGFSYQCQLEMPAEQFETTKAALRQLVDLRNALVHNFIDRFNLWSAAGCLAADEFLEQSYQTIHQHYLDLRSWAKHMDQSRIMMASFIQSRAFDEIFEGNKKSGSVDWTKSDIYQCLCEAETQLAKDGWTRLEAAISWIGHTYPKQTPKQYGCSSWGQVLHESRGFEIRKDRADGQRTVVWYRRKVR